MTKTLQYVGIGIAGILAIVAIGYGIRWVTAPMRGSTEAREQTVGDGSYRLAAYEEFYDRCAAIQSLEDQIDQTEADQTLPKNQRATNVLALTNQRATLVRRYNADAAKADTAGAFRADGLPYAIKLEEKTTCSSDD